LLLDQLNTEINNELNIMINTLKRMSGSTAYRVRVRKCICVEESQGPDVVKESSTVQWETAD
jgi:hypothetical protein